MAALYRAADVMVVTPLRDGMNLVAKEYVACRYDDRGALVLSEFAGAASELKAAYQVNPHDINGMKSMMLEAINAEPARERPAHEGDAQAGHGERHRPVGRQLPRELTSVRDPHAKKLRPPAVHDAPRASGTRRPTSVGDHVAARPAAVPHHAAGMLAASDDDEVFRWQSFARPTTHRGGRGAASTGTGPAERPHLGPGRSGQRRGRRADDVLRDRPRNRPSRSARRGWVGGSGVRAVNTEAKLLLLRRAFDDLDCARVVWHVDILNERSQAAVERIGGVREGVLRKHIIRRDGSWRDTVVFSMTDDEWPAARDALEERFAR